VEISNDSTTAQVLALTIVAEAKVGKPNFLEGVKVIFTDGKNFFMNDPVHDICARRICQGSLVVIEWVDFECRRRCQLLSLVRELLLNSSNLGRGQGVEQLGKVNLFDQAEVEGAEFLNEGMAVISLLEEDSNNCQSLFVILPASWTIDKFMYNVDFEIILLSIKAMLTWAVHVEMINVVVERALAVKVCYFDTAQVSALQL